MSKALSSLLSALAVGSVAKGIIVALDYSEMGPTTFVLRVASGPHVDIIAEYLIWSIAPIFGFVAFLVELKYQPIARYFARRIPIFLEANATNYVVRWRGTDSDNRHEFDLTGILEPEFESIPKGAPFGVTIINASETRLINVSIQFSLGGPPLHMLIPAFRLLPAVEVAVEGNRVGIRMTRGKRTNLNTVTINRKATVTVPIIEPSQFREGETTGHRIAFPSELVRAIGLHGYVRSLLKGIAQMQEARQSKDVLAEIEELPNAPVDQLIRRMREREAQMKVDLPKIKLKIWCITADGSSIHKGIYECRLKFTPFFPPFQVETETGVGVHETKAFLSLESLNLVG
jgi:hypothetical protein